MTCEAHARPGRFPGRGAGLAAPARLAQATAGFNTVLMAVALPSAQGELGLTGSGRLWAVAGYDLALGGTVLLGRRLAAPLGGRRGLIAGGAGLAAASVLGCLAGTGALITARALQGLFAGLMLTAAVTALAAAPGAGGRGGARLGRATAVFCTGGALGVVVGWPLTGGLDWRWCLFATAPPALAVALGALLAGRPRRTPGARPPAPAGTGHDWALLLATVALCAAGVRTLLLFTSYPFHNGGRALLAAAALALLPLAVAAFTVGAGTPAPALPAASPAPRSGPDVHVHGQVRRSGDAPVPCARVTVLDDEGRTVAAGRAAEDGRYHLSLPGPGAYVLVAAARSHLPATTELTVAAPGTEVTVRLTETTGVSGSVREDLLRMPVAHALVVLTDNDGAVAGSCVTGEDGHYAFPGLPPGPYALAVAHRHYAPLTRPVTVPADRPVEADMEVARGISRLEGLVRTAGGGTAAGAHLTLADDTGTVLETTADRYGRYLFPCVPTGTYVLRAAAVARAAADGEPARGDATVTVGREDCRADVRLGLHSED
ncbi:MFS transporter [Streptomyces cinnamoneus]|uniref:MFS transporter n=1 Tax=Streptomyces cinnamoneus TaxID=53446 RepID=UPI003407B225